MRPHLEAVEAALTADRAAPVMRLHATPAFADAWLMPRLAALVALVAPRPLELVTAATPFERTRRPAPGNATYHLVTRRADLASPPIRRLHAWAGAPG